MSSPSLEITQALARAILESEVICYSEGQGGGPEMDKLLLFIREHYPELAQLYAYLPWDEYEKGE